MTHNTPAPASDKALAERLARASNALDLAQAQVGGRGWAHERQVLVDELLSAHRSSQLITLAEAQAMVAAAYEAAAVICEAAPEMVAGRVLWPPSKKSIAAAIRAVATGTKEGE